MSVLFIHTGNRTNPLLESVIYDLEPDARMVRTVNIANSNIDLRLMEQTRLVVVYVTSNFERVVSQLKLLSVHYVKSLFFVDESISDINLNFIGSDDVFHLPMEQTEIKNLLHYRLNSSVSASDMQAEYPENITLSPLTLVGSKLAFPTPKGAEFIPLDELLYVESVRNDIVVYSRSDARKPFLALLSLKKFDEITANSFFSRIHQSYSVNLNAVQSYTKGDGGVVTLENGKQLLVSRGKKEAFLRKVMPWKEY